MELDELQIAKSRPCPRRHGEAVAGILRRVGGMEEDAADAAGRQHHVAGAMEDPAAIGVAGQDAMDTTVADDQIGGERLRHHRDGRGAADAGGELVGQDAAGGVTAGMDDPRSPVGRFAAQQRRTVGIPVEGGAGCYQAGGPDRRLPPPAVGPSGLR